MKIKRGMLVLADLGRHVNDSVQGGIRPVVVVSNNRCNQCLHGYSPERIANYLNEHDIISPYEYKKANSNYKSGFKGAGEGVWNHTTVRRILKNSVYTGELCQGKTTTVSYKVKKVKELDREDWAIVDEAHDAIIPKCIFEVVGKVLSRDIRMSDSEKEVQALAGFIFCGDCGKAMSRRTVKRGNKVFHYYLYWML